MSDIGELVGKVQLAAVCLMKLSSFEAGKYLDG